MNILFLDQFSELGGAQQCLLDLLPAIAERGWTARAALPPGGPLVDLLRGHGLCVSDIQSGPYGCGRKSTADLFRFVTDVPAQVSTIATLLDQSSADLLYVNGPRLLISAALAARGRAPILFHAHHCIGQAGIGQTGAAYLEGLALRRSSATVIACCDAVAQPLRRWTPRERIHIAPNGTADLGFREPVFGQEVRIGIVGRIAPEKGQVEFLRAAALLAPDAPHVRFVICGSALFGESAYYDEVLRHARGLPVELLGWRKDAGAVMRGLDILVIASKQEGMPRVLLEAFSVGLPVVAFPVGGIPEAIEDGITGFLTRDLRLTLKTVLETDVEKIRSVARHAHRKWESRYTLAAYRECVMNLMEQSAARETTGRRRRKSAMRQSAPEDTRSA